MRIDGFQPFPGEWVEQKGPPVTVVVFFWKVHQHGCHVFCVNCLLGMVETHLYSSNDQLHDVNDYNNNKTMK